MKRPRLLTSIVALVVAASGWDAVVGRLRRRGYDVLAPANPLRGIAPDAAYLRSVLKTIKGPIVLVGHS